jgi:hypothetical protein
MSDQEIADALARLAEMDAKVESIAISIIETSRELSAAGTSK